ncbi:hypothetical protein CC78DRAFT_146241 [Lojkania enalia]|uniref:CENP-V/GFA domain-containing protein n=1 Tax=Lojkania enalia TaxID=147567 RepID=A0A9P4N4C0_9PLEO|nr:hypothetical protein CC78DRAFT_146241 [Didymosphaeria enalia]
MATNAPTPSLQVTGSCLCRKVKYTITGEPFNTALCHCKNCARTSGVGFGANSFYSKSQFTINSGAEALREYVDSATASGNFLYRNFCGNCGSPLFTRNSAMEDLVVVTSGSLDDGQEWKPSIEVFCRNKANWVEANWKGETVRFEAMPSRK